MLIITRQQITKKREEEILIVVPISNQDVSLTAQNITQ
jgi:hypothetical protein